MKPAHSLAAADHESALVEFRQGDVYDLPLSKHEWGHFDVVHSRFLLEHVPDNPWRPEETQHSVLAGLLEGKAQKVPASSTVRSQPGGRTHVMSP